MRKTDQVLMWEAFEGSISQGGPLGGSSKSSSSGQSSGNDSEESDAPGLMGLLAQVLQGVEDGSIDESEACEHLSMILNGEAGEEDDSPEEQDTADEDEDCMEDDEDYEEDYEEEGEDKDDKKEDPSNEYKNSIRRYMPKDSKNFGKQNQPGKRPGRHNLPVRNRRTTDTQEGI